MKINHVNFYLYEEPFKSPIITPKIKLEQRQCLFIELVDEEGHSYFGECNAFATNWYDDETIPSVKKDIKRWFASVQSQHIATYEAWLATLQMLEHSPAARSTVVMALYQKYHQLTQFNVAYGATVSGLSTIQLQQLQQTKPQRIKLKWSKELLKDIETLKQLDFQFKLAVDANESLTEADVTTLLNLKDKVLYIEEPFKNMTQLNEINQQALPPIAIDEKARHIEQIKALVTSYPINVVVVKPFRLGGIDRVQQIIKLLHQLNVKVVIGGMYEYGLSRYFTAMLAKEGDYPGDVTPTGYYFKQDVVVESGILKGGSIEFHPPKIDIAQLQPY
ncbi:o-succinylbenzoate synthase [Staphylococcus simiae]|nr:o-succinylbenzoate synthase [Staphylococcus simiae]PNZ13564.1 o-succinylbenzoate synthase [Staphylococcus simiae]